MWPVFHGNPELWAHPSPGLLVLSMQRVLRSAACWAVRVVPVFQEAVFPREVGEVGFQSSRRLSFPGRWGK